MSIVWVREISGARSRSLDVSSSEWVRDYTRAFRVLSDDPNENIVLVSTASAGGVAIPDVFTQHPHDNRSFLFRKDTRPVGSEEYKRKLWQVTCGYSVTKRPQDFVHPLDRPWEIDYDGESYQTIAEFDKFGTGAMNSAGQYFDPPLQVDNTRGVLTITRNEPFFDGDLVRTYQESINSDTFLGGPPYTVKCKRIKAKRVFENFQISEGVEPLVVEYWPTTYEFHYWYKTWWLFPLDQGRYELDSGGTSLVSIKDSDDTAVVDPVPLDGAGHQVPPASLPGGAVFMTYRYYRELPFGPLGFT